MQINGPALKVARERAGYSQAELSRQSGVAQSRLSKLENSGRPQTATPATVRKLADTLCVPAAAILAVPEERAS